MKTRVSLSVLLIPFLAATSCTRAAPPGARTPRATTATSSVRPRAEFSPQNARLVGTIRVPEPAGDDIRLFQPILLDAYKVACPVALDVQAEVRHSGSKVFVVVRCADHPTRAVRVVYTGVTVPDLVGSYAHSLSTLAAMLGLRITETSRPARSGQKRNTIVRQTPSPGNVVPFGTTLKLVVAI